MTRQLPRATYVIMACVYALVALGLGGGGAAAIPETDLMSVRKHTPWYGDSAGGAETKACSTSTSSGGSTDQLTGVSNGEKIWNYFVGKGLGSVAIAGIMGNFVEENASFDPAGKQAGSMAAIPPKGDGVTGYGIAQWTYPTRQAGLFAKIDAAGLSKYYGAGYGNQDIDKQLFSKPEAGDDSNKLLKIELDYAWSGDSTPISSFAKELNAKESVEGDSGSALFFHNTFENSDDKAAGLKERIDSAKRMLGQYGSNSCGSLGGVSSVKDALPWAAKFIEAIHRFNAQTSPLDGVDMGDGKSYYSVADGATCTFDTTMSCEQCTALSGWFVAAMTDYTYAGGDGQEVVGNLAARGVPTGNTPKPFSVFSMTAAAVDNSAGHTGVVLGVLDGGVVITLENNWPGNRLSIRQYNITEKFPGTTFAYVGTKMKDGALSN